MKEERQTERRFEKIGSKILWKQETKKEKKGMNESVVESTFFFLKTKKKQRPSKWHFKGFRYKNKIFKKEKKPQLSLSANQPTTAIAPPHL